MTHSEKEVLDWLLAHCEHDRVLYNALTNHQQEPSVLWIGKSGRWRVDAVRRISGKDLHVFVLPHIVTREPHQYYRVEEYADA